MSVSIQRERARVNTVCPHVLNNLLLCVLSASQLVDLDGFVEMTKKYAQGIIPTAPQSSNHDVPQNKSPTPQSNEEKVAKCEMICLSPGNADIVLNLNYSNSG